MSHVYLLRTAAGNILLGLQIVFDQLMNLFIGKRIHFTFVVDGEKEYGGRSDFYKG